MGREQLEVPLLGVLDELGRDDLALHQLVDQPTLADLGERGADVWVREIAERADPGDRTDRFWMAQALVLAVRSGRRDLRAPSRELAERLLSPFEERGDGSTDPARLIDVIQALAPEEPISEDALRHLAGALPGVLEIGGEAAHERILLSGAGAELATLLLELSTSSLSCHLEVHTVDVHGTPKEVIFVEVDTCTNRVFDDCRRAIDPRAWPKANPFFRSVTVLGTVQTSGADWCGTIKERVGPGINGKVYETDLDVTYLERPGMAVTAFDLAKVRSDPGAVTVDRGFLSCTDEGLHRRIRTVKVYRIEDLDMPPSWICPLWASQFALAAWWAA